MARFGSRRTRTRLPHKTNDLYMKTAWVLSLGLIICGSYALHRYTGTSE